MNKQVALNLKALLPPPLDIPVTYNDIRRKSWGVAIPKPATHSEFKNLNDMINIAYPIR